MLYYIDKYDKEPLGVMVKIFILGCISVIPTIIVESFLSGCNIIGGFVSVLFTAFIVAGFVEEYFKYLVVRFKVLNSPEFDEPVDAMIYMIIAGLGFAALENILYLHLGIS